MRKEIKTSLMLLILTIGIFGAGLISLAVTASTTEYPDYVGVDITSGLAGKIEMPRLDPEFTNAEYQYEADGLGMSTPGVGTTVYDWYLGSLSGDPYMTLRYIDRNVEIWVQDDMSFPDGDARNDDPYNLMISEEMIEHLAYHFNDIIYPIDVEFFGEPYDRDGTGTIFEALGWPSFTYDWINATDNPQRTILKILNYRDENYVDPTYPYYVVGFFNPGYDGYYNRNMIHLDPWRYWQRLGEEGTVWFDERPDLVNTRPYVYESTTAHEYQHLIHADYQPDDPLWMNEGCSTFAEIKCGYPVDYNSINSFLYTPDNSLTDWGDQGDINILADYGQVQMFCTYINDHYSTDTVQFLSEFVQAGIPGIEGLETALANLGFTETFNEIFNDWRIANLIHSGDGKYNYKTIDLSLADPINVHDIPGREVPWTYGAEAFGNTETILGYDTGVAEVASYGTEYISMSELRGGNFILFKGDETATPMDSWIWDGYWFSGAADLMNILIGTEVYVDPADPYLELTTYWDIEDYWDFGFVQVSEDGGDWESTWTSLENEYTTYDHDPNAHPDIIATLPGLTIWSGFITPDGIVTMTFNLSAYAGQTIDLGFRYMTDWGTTYEGWYIFNAVVSGIDYVADFVPILPEFPASWMVTVVEQKTRPNGKVTYYIHDMYVLECLDNWGLSIAWASHNEDIILLISPLMDAGYTDYGFEVKHFGRKCR